MNRFWKGGLSAIAFIALLITGMGWVATAHANPYIPFQGGTGTSTTPLSGQTLIGNASGTYSPHYITCVSGCSIATSSGGIAITGTGGGAGGFNATGTPQQLVIFTGTSTGLGYSDLTFATSSNTMTLDGNGLISYDDGLQNFNFANGAASANPILTLDNEGNLIITPRGGNFIVQDNSTNNQAIFSTSLLSSNRTLSFPDENGTFALGGGTGTTGNCVTWSDSNTVGDAGAPCGSGGVATTTPYTVGNIAVVSSSGALATISSGTYYLASNPSLFISTSSLKTINGSSGTYNIYVAGTGLTISTGTASTTIKWTSPGYITAAPATTTYTAQGSTITTTALTIATSGPLNSATVSGSTLTITSIPTSTILAGYSTSTPSSLAGPYLGVSGTALTVSSTIASTSIPISIPDPTSTLPYKYEAFVQVPFQFSLQSLSCEEWTNQASTTITVFRATADTSTVDSIIATSTACGNITTSTTSFATTTIPAGDFIFVAVTSTAGTPQLTHVWLNGKKQ